MKLRNRDDGRILDVADEHAYVLEVLGWERMAPPTPKPRARKAKPKQPEEQ